MSAVIDSEFLKQNMQYDDNDEDEVYILNLFKKLETETNSKAKSTEDEKASLEGKVEILKELYHDICEQNEDDERKLRQQLRCSIEEQVKTDKDHEKSLNQLRDELERERMLRQKDLVDQQEMNRIRSENQALKDQNSSLQSALNISITEISELKEQLINLQQCMIDDKNKIDSQISTYKKNSILERRQRTEMEREISYLKTDLKYIKTLLHNEDIIVINKTDSRFQTNTLQNKQFEFTEPNYNKDIDRFV